MAIAMSYNKAPPLLRHSKNYEDWKKLMNIWTELTTLYKSGKSPPWYLLSVEKHKRPSWN